MKYYKKFIQINYLEHYGYLEEKYREMHDRNTITSAIRDFQKFFELPETGLLDDATLKVSLLYQEKKCENNCFRV